MPSIRLRPKAGPAAALASPPDLATARGASLLRSGATAVSAQADGLRLASCSPPGSPSAHR